MARHIIAVIYTTACVKRLSQLVMAEDKQEAPVLFVDARNILRDDKLPTYLVGVRV